MTRIAKEGLCGTNGLCGLMVGGERAEGVGIGLVFIEGCLAVGDLGS